MNLIDRGQGVPVIVVPGIQGRWEWHRPGIDALARHCRVLTFAYADQTAGHSSSRSCIDDYCDQIAEAMETAGLSTAVLCGISYGGLVAAVFAARHPEKVTALVLASALPPTWKPDRRVASYLRFPRLMMPIFMLASLRMFTEIRRASSGFGPALTMAFRHGWNAVTHMFQPTAMARRAATIPSGRLAADCRLDRRSDAGDCRRSHTRSGRSSDVYTGLRTPGAAGARRHARTHRSPWMRDASRRVCRTGVVLCQRQCRVRPDDGRGSFSSCRVCAEAPWLRSCARFPGPKDSSNA